MTASRVLYVDERTVWRSAGAALCRSRDRGLNWELVAVPAISRVARAVASVRVAARLARAGIHHLLPAAGLALVGNAVFRLDEPASTLRRVASLHGSRPLAVATDGQLTCYGEYRSNPERSPVHVWRLDPDGAAPEPLWRFTGVRHVHGVYHDACTGAFWVTTGDEDGECGIWCTPDRFRTLERVLGGSQQVRAVPLLFDAHHVYFGSDSPSEKNFLYRMERGTFRVERLQPVGSSVMHACRAGPAFFFSTAVEPSAVNTGRDAEIWGSLDGERWKLVMRFRKDAWSKRYFQYGQVMFPSGPGDGQNLWFTPYATRGDQRPCRSSLAELGLP
jgi:hypothetical protein